MSFFRHEEIYQSDEGRKRSGERPKSRPPTHRSDESPAGYSWCCPNLNFQIGGLRYNPAHDARCHLGNTRTPQIFEISWERRDVS
jgi:hypothetical protein